MMEMLFMIAIVTFGLSAAMWFTVWAFWIHANAAAYGPAPRGYAAVAIAEPIDPALQRRLAWYRRVKRLTLVSLFVTIVLGAFVLGGRAR